MKVQDATGLETQIRHLIGSAVEGTARYRIRRSTSQWTNDNITISQGCDEYILELGRDGNWRLSSRSTYGNRSSIAGAGCDASGFVIRDTWTLATIAALMIATKR